VTHGIYCTIIDLYMKRINISIVFAVAILAIGSFVFISNNSSAAINCSLSLLDKNGNSISQVIAGDTVTWKFKAHINNLSVFWYGSKDGKKDIWDKTNGYFSNSSYSGAIYKNGEEGSYSRYVAFKNDVGKTICVSNPVNFSVTNGIITKAEIPTVAKPETSGPKVSDFLKGEISGAISLAPYTGSLDFNCDGSVATDDVDAITNLWRGGTVFNVTTVTSLGKTCSNLGAYAGYLWRNGVTTMSISELTRLAVAIKAQPSTTPTPTPTPAILYGPTISLDPSTPMAQQVSAGSSRVTFLKFNIANPNSLPIRIIGLSASLNGTADPNGAGVTKIYWYDQSSNLLGQSVWSASKDVGYTNTKTDFSVPANSKTTVTVMADIAANIPSKVTAGFKLTQYHVVTSDYHAALGNFPIVGNIMEIMPSPVSTPTPTPSSIAVSLSPTTAIPMDISHGSSGVSVMSFKISNPLSRDINVTHVSLSSEGTAKPGDISKIYIYDGTTLLGSNPFGTISGQPYSVATFGTDDQWCGYNCPPFIIVPANSSKVIMVKVDTAWTLSASQVNFAIIASLFTADRLPISGVPVTGNSMTISGTIESPGLNVSLSAITPSSAELLAGAKSVKLVTADLTVSNSADVLLTNLVPVLTYENNSNRVKSGLTNFRLVDENNNLVGTSYGNDAWMNGEVIYFKDLKSTITKGTIRRLSLIADLNEKSTHIPSFKAEIWGSTYMGAQNYTTGQYVPTTGKATGNIMTIASLPTTPTPTPVPLANGQKILVLQLKYSDTPASKVVWTKNQINELVFGKVQDFYKRVSYDKVHFSGDISNLYTISRNAKDGVYDDCRPDIGSVDSEVYKLLKNDYNLENYDSLMMVLYVPDYCNLRSWGSSNSMNNISGMRDPDFRIGVTLIRADIGDYDGIIAHELGHTLFNLKHAKSRFCEAGQYITGSNCVETEAGNFFDIMGSDLQLSSSNFNALLKERMGWLDNLSLLKIDKSGTYTINTIEATSGYRAAKLVNNVVNNNRPIYIEYRQLDPARYSFKLDGLIVNIPLTVNDTDWPLLNGSTLIDMTPTGISPNDEQDVTLRRSDLIPSGQSKTFLYQNWGIELGPVLSNNDKQITFNVRIFDPLILATTPIISPPVASLPTDSEISSENVISAKIYSEGEIYDGDIIRAQGDIAVWIIKISGEKKFKRWLFGPQLFKIYGHLGFNKVKNVTKITLSQFDTTNLIRKDGDEKVYELTDYIPGVQAIKRWVPSYEVFLKRGFDKDAIYTVNDGEFALYKLGSRLQY